MPQSMKTPIAAIDAGLSSGQRVCFLDLSRDGRDIRGGGVPRLVQEALNARRAKLRGMRGRQCERGESRWLVHALLTSTLLGSSAGLALADPLTLTGSYLKVGISDYGTFGSDGSTSPGLLHDPTGKGNFVANTDYLTPGNPHDGFAINSTQTGLLINDNNQSSSSFGITPPTLLTGAAAKGFSNAATWTSSNGSVQVTNSYFFNSGDERVRISSTITALTNLTNVAFGRSEDPDPDSLSFSSSSTVNTRGDSATAPQDLVSGAGVKTGLTIGILNASGSAFAHNTEISTGCCSNLDPYTVLSNTDPLAYPTTNTGDYGLQMAWLLGNMTAGESLTINYDYVFGTNQDDVSAGATTIGTTGGDIGPGLFSLASSAATAATVVFDGGTLQMSGGSFLNNVISAPVNITANNGTIDTSTGNGGFSGVVSGPGSLTINGGGTFSLTGANTYAGGTILNASTVAVGGDTALGTGTVTFNNGRLQAAADGLTLTNAATLVGGGTIDTQAYGLTYGGVLSGTGGLTKIGSGTLSLTALNAYTGLTTVSAGTLSIASTGGIGSDVAVAQGASVKNAGTIQGSLTNAGSVTNTGTWTGDVVSSRGAIINAGTWTTLTKTGFNTGGTLTTTGVLDATVGGLTNNGVINANGGSILGAITNKGSFAVGGAVTANAVFNNAAGATLDIGSQSLAGITTLTNDGTVSLGQSGLLRATSVINNNTFYSTGGTVQGNFTNAATGTIDLTRGGTASNNSLTIAGNYVGAAGSQLLVSLTPQAGTADKLIIKGNASGATAVSVAQLGPSAQFGNVTIVQGGGAGASTTFSLAPTQVGTGRLTLISTGGTISVTLAPTIQGVATGPVAASVPATISFQSTQAVIDHDTQIRNDTQEQTGTVPVANFYAPLEIPNDPISARMKAVAPLPVMLSVGTAAWARGFGDYESNSKHASFTFLGTSVSQGLGYEQSTGGLVGGYDWIVSGLSSVDDGLIIGPLAGFTTAHVDISNSSSKIDYSGGTLGAHGTYFNGGFFLDTIAKVDLLGIKLAGSALSQSTNLQNVSLSGAVGYKFDLDKKWYVEPSTGIDYVHTSFDRHFSFSPTTVKFSDGDATRGKVSLRFGTTWRDGDTRYEPSLTATAYEILAASKQSISLDGVTPVTLGSDAGRVSGEFQAAFNVANLKTGWSGFVKSEFRVGDSYMAGGGFVGVRKSF